MASRAGREIVLPGAEPGRLQRQLERVLLPAELLLDLLVLREVAHPPGEARAGGPRASCTLVVETDPQKRLPSFRSSQRSVVYRPCRAASARSAAGAPRLPVIGGIEVGGGALRNSALLVAQHAADAGFQLVGLPSRVEQDDGVVLDLVERGAEALLVAGLLRVGEETTWRLRGRSSSGRALRRHGSRRRREIAHLLTTITPMISEHDQDQDGRRGADGRRQKQEGYGEQHGAVTE